MACDNMIFGKCFEEIWYRPAPGGADQIHTNNRQKGKAKTMYRILLVDDEIIYKKRGLGMFVKEGAVEKIRQKRQGQFYDQFIATLIEEANKLNMSKDEIIKLIERGYDNECNSN